MKAYTFYNPIPGYSDARPLIYLWEQSWRKNGWKTEVLSEKDAASQPGYEEFKRTVGAYPTVNGKPYEHACYIRWVAMAGVEDSWSVLSDYDVINRSFTPRDAENTLGSRTLVMLEPTRVPCAVLGTPSGFRDVRDMIGCYRPVLSDKHDGVFHVSDMTILRKSNMPTSNVCIEHGCSGKDIRDHLGDGWRKAPLIHFSTYSFIRLKIPACKSKADRIKTELAKL